MLQAAHLRQVLVADGTLRGELHEANNGLGVEGGEAVDDAGGAEEDDGAELLAEAGVDAELVMVDLGIGGDLDVVGDVAVGPGGVRGNSGKRVGQNSHLAADDLGVLSQLRVCVRLDDHTIRDAGIVVSAPTLEASLAMWEE